MVRKIVIFSILFIFIFSVSNIQAQEKNVQKDSCTKEKTSVIEKVEKWYEANMNYTTITILMTIESSFIPFPSEIVIPPAAYVASKPDSKLNIFLVVLFGTLGALIGALVNYFLALWLGRIIIYKFADSKLGHLCLLNSEKIKKAENYFNEHGKISTFIGRLIPGIRQLISIPAGLAKMEILSFMLYTILGAGIWNVLLALIGHLAHGQQDLINKYNQELSYAIIVIFCIVVLFFIFKHFKKKQ